jgi:hypothetical protein
MDSILLLMSEYRLGLSLKTSKYLKYLRDDVNSVSLQEFVDELKHLCATEPGPVAETKELIEKFEEFSRQIDHLITQEEPTFEDKVKCHTHMVGLEALLERLDITIPNDEPGYARNRLGRNSSA